MRLLKVTKRDYARTAMGNSPGSNCGSTGSQNCGSCAHSTNSSGK